MPGRLIHDLPPGQLVSGPNGEIHPDLLRWLGHLTRAVNLAIPPTAAVVFANLTSAQVTAYFETDGAGKAGTEYAGWAICNGNNGTPDIDGKLVLAEETGAGGTGSFDFTAGAVSASYHELVPLMRLEVSA